MRCATAPSSVATRRISSFIPSTFSSVTSRFPTRPGSSTNVVTSRRYSSQRSVGVVPLRERVQKGAVTPQRTVPHPIAYPSYGGSGVVTESLSERTGTIPILDEVEEGRLRRSCRLAKDMLDYAGSLVKPGVTTEEIDMLVHEKIIENDAYPSPLNYRNFSKSICTSVNEVLCHGIPDSRPLVLGDIVNVDVSVFRENFHGDCSHTFVVGGVTDKERLKLVDFTERCLYSAINICGPGVPYHKIGEVINDMADAEGFGIAPEFTGHGIGKEFHQLPWIVHARNRYQTFRVMEVGQAFTIEPIIVASPDTEWSIWNDQWTYTTHDFSPSAQFEHTLLVTRNGVDILTRGKNWGKFSTYLDGASSPSSSSSDVNNSLINLCMTIGAPTTAKEVFFIRVRNECCGSDRNDSGSGCDIVDDSDNADDEPNSMMVCSHVVMDLVSCESYNDTLESRLDPKRVYFLTRRRTELDSLPHFTPKTSLSLRGKKNRTLVYIDVVGGRERPVCVCSSDEEDDDIDVDDSDGDDDTIGDGDDDGSDDDDDVDVDAVMSDLEGEDGTAWFQFKEFLVGV
eukprot:TRINITY_DN1541_c0_g1_i2.p1 TRINITY_DN1541_c0_g1~~TRINITY_DN1541_c0_g1_i2.p1  ORF type:complete len:610 (-),score=107.39 TRINITY_DN1541_c0_g1_i2:24-1724(-)